jgi:hypothetical protein
MPKINTSRAAARNASDDAKLAAKIVEAVREFDAADAVKKEKAIVAGATLRLGKN